MSAILARYNALPRAAKWGLLAALAIGFYFGGVEPALNAMNTWTTRANNKERELTAFAKEREARKGADDAAALGVTRYGIVEPPGDPAERSAAFNRRVSQVLEAEGIKQSTSTSSESPVGRNSMLQQFFGVEASVQKIGSELRFDATPEQLARVVAALEQSPEVSSISRVQVRQGASGGGEKNPRLLGVTMKVQAWQVRPKARGRAG